MKESTPSAANDPDAGEPREEPTQEASEAAAAGEPDSRRVPDKQIGRWKDDGGAVDFTS